MTAASGQFDRARTTRATSAALSPAALAGCIDARALDPTAPLACDDDGREVAIAAPGLDLRCDRRVQWHATATTITLIVGRPRLDGRPAEVEQVARRLVSGPDAWPRLGGHHALIHVDVAAGEVVLATDRFGTFPLAWRRDGARIGFSDRADRVPGADALDPQALFDYVYFHAIPAPRTVFRGVHRLEPCTALRISSRGIEARRTWEPGFASSRGTAPTHAEFRAAVRRAVLDAEGPAAGCFLSGGTDSSTVAGMLARERGRVKTFSIGFDADGYDEMTFARIAARHFGTEHHEYYVTPEDLVRSVPLVAAHYDQPFGNSSAVPAYACARMAAQEGVRTMLAGDGGDELFGGNVRYAKQKVFEAYGRIPAPLRAAVVEPILLSGAARAMPGAAKAASYVAQARVPMPARTETYNLLRRFGVAGVFAPRFLALVDEAAPGSLQDEVYRRSEGAAFVDRMLAYDWRFTLSDNDLPKVAGTTALAGIAARFPLLDDALVDLSLRLPPGQKVRGLRLRHFFKEALSDFLPPEIIAKKKHGFGLPVGPWLVTNPAFRAMARDSLNGLADRQIIQPALVHDLFSRRLEEHPGYYGEMAWVLMMAEQWMRSHAPSWTCP